MATAADQDTVIGKAGSTSTTKWDADCAGIDDGSWQRRDICAAQGRSIGHAAFGVDVNF